MRGDVSGTWGDGPGPSSVPSPLRPRNEVRAETRSGRGPVGGGGRVGSRTLTGVRPRVLDRKTVRGRDTRTPSESSREREVLGVSSEYGERRIVCWEDLGHRGRW